MTFVALSEPLARQAVATGRLTEGITGFAFPVFDAALHYEDPGSAGRWLDYPATFKRGNGGWFAFHLDPQRAAPALDGIAQVNLRMTFAVPGRSPLEVTRSTPGPDLQPTETAVTIAGQPVNVLLLPGAPVDFSTSLDPLPVALAGYVLRDHDPETPAPGATVSITAPAAPTTTLTDAAGWFRLEPLPLAAAVTVRATDGARSVEQTVHTDFSTPINQTILSVSTA